MPNCLAFFPWLTIREPVAVGDIRLVPFRCGQAPGDSEFASQADMDAIVAAYSLRKNIPVERATLFEFGDWRNGQDLTVEGSSELFRARELLAFSALAHRQMFQREQYSNFHTFSLSVQRYSAGGAGAFSFDVRRRDQDVSHLWNAEEFAFLKPLHVEAGARLFFDVQLLDALLRAYKAGECPFAAIEEFNSANTDSSDMPLHTEVVMAKSAFEFLLGIDQHAESFANAIVPLIPAFKPDEDFPCPEFARWAGRFTQAARPIESWVREFCVRRNEAGHGQRRGGDHHVWTQEAHLAFAAILFPMLVRQQLAAKGFLELSERKQVELEWVEAYLGYDPYAPRAARASPHEWERIRSDGVIGEISRRRMDDLSTKFHAGEDS
jgi:hypothetical protein